MAQHSRGRRERARVYAQQWCGRRRAQQRVRDREWGRRSDHAGQRVHERPQPLLHHGRVRRARRVDLVHRPRFVLRRALGRCGHRDGREQRLRGPGLHRRRRGRLHAALALRAGAGRRPRRADRHRRHGSAHACRHRPRPRRHRGGGTRPHLRAARRDVRDPGRLRHARRGDGGARAPGRVRRGHVLDQPRQLRRAGRDRAVGRRQRRRPAHRHVGHQHGRRRDAELRSHIDLGQLRPRARRRTARHPAEPHPRCGQRELHHGDPAGWRTARCRHHQQRHYISAHQLVVVDAGAHPHQREPTGDGRRHDLRQHVRGRRLGGPPRRKQQHASDEPLVHRQHRRRRVRGLPTVPNGRAAHPEQRHHRRHVRRVPQRRDRRRCPRGAEPRCGRVLRHLRAKPRRRERERGRAIQQRRPRQHAGDQCDRVGPLADLVQHGCLDRQRRAGAVRQRRRGPRRARQRALGERRRGLWQRVHGPHVVHERLQRALHHRRDSGPRGRDRVRRPRRVFGRPRCSDRHHNGREQRLRRPHLPGPARGRRDARRARARRDLRARAGRRGPRRRRPQHADAHRPRRGRLHDAADAARSGRLLDPR